MLKQFLIALTIIIFMNGCDYNEKYTLVDLKNDTYLLDKENGSLFVIKNTSMFKIKEEEILSNKVNTVIDTKATVYQTSIDIRCKLYNDVIFYNLNIEFVPNTDKNGSMNFIQWRDKILDSNKYYNIELVFLDKDGFKISTKRLFLKDISVNTIDENGKTIGMTYEGNIEINQYLSSKIDSVTYYYSLPDFK